MSSLPRNARSHPIADQGDCNIGLGKGPGPNRKYMLHARSDKNTGVHARDPRITCQAHGIIEQNLFTTDQT